MHAACASVPDALPVLVLSCVPVVHYHSANLLDCLLIKQLKAISSFVSIVTLKSMDRIRKLFGGKPTTTEEEALEALAKAPLTRKSLGIVQKVSS